MDIGGSDDRSRRGTLPLSLDVTMMAETIKDSKEQVITASVILYILAYLMVGIGGVSFHSQPVMGYITKTSNTACGAGSTWIDGSNLHWCDGSYEYYAADESGDPISYEGSPSGATVGSIWVEGDRLHWIDESGNEYSILGNYKSNPSGATNGAVWVEDDSNANGLINYIDQDGHKRALCDDGGDHNLVC